MNIRQGRRAGAGKAGTILSTATLPAALLALLVAGQVAAQDETLQEVTVTGTRIKAPNLVSESPVTAVSGEELQQLGTPNIENMLNEMPQVHTAQSGSTSNNSTGVANVNLRGLGPTRTLVLIDGRRLGPGDPQNALGAAADVNFIPSAMVTSVDILTGGASAIYGSDAVAGVVNFHLLRNFEGISFTENYNAAQHSQSGLADPILKSAPYVYPTPIPGSQFDGFIRDTTVILGGNTGDKRGNITVYGEYRATSPVLDGTRDFLACETGTNAANTQLVCKGSTNTRYGYFITNANKKLSLNPNGSATFVSFPSDGSLRENTAPTNYLQRQDDRLTFGALAHEQILPWLDVYSDLMFMEDKTAAQVAGGGLFSARGPTGTVQIPCNNPFLSAAEESAICQTASGKPMPIYQSNGQPNIATITMPGIRFNNYPRVDDMQHDDYRAVLGARGTIRDNWTFDVSGSYWDSILSEHYLNDVSFTRLQNSLLGCTEPGSAGCVPVNIFQYGGVTPQMFNYLSVPGEKTGSNRQMIVEANIAGDFGPYGGISPWAVNPVATSFGISYRRDELNFLPDYELQTNDLISQTGTFPPVSGAENVTEEYAELRVPIVEKKPFISSVNLDLAFRHADYKIDNSNSAYSTNSYKIGADYAPVDDIRFRGGYNRAARAPNLNELFLPTSLTADAGDTDFCAGAKPIASLAACAKTGVTPAQYGNIVECPSGNCYAQQGGNLALKPEEAETWTYGVNLTPSFIPGFNASVDYWDVRVGNYITNLAGAQILGGCLLQSQTDLCNL
ncbi:MAG TPA: TonB-dependent receptor, partial [Magnetospirillaceae bacterium]|nr:TonB-dependent receptor [Magnetospirillaceae bacterium]